MAQIEGVKGVVLERGEEGYEDVRQAVVWHHRKPDRYPDVIVRVKDDQDVGRAAYRGHVGLRVRRGGGIGGACIHPHAAVRSGFYQRDQVVFGARAGGNPYDSEKYVLHAHAENLPGCRSDERRAIHEGVLGSYW